MKKVFIILVITSWIICFGAMCEASIIQYNTTGYLNYYNSNQDPDFCSLPISGAVFILDEGNLPENYPTATYSIVNYNLTIGTYNLIQDNPAGQVHFGTHDVYVNIGGGSFTEAFIGPIFYTHFELPASFAVYSYNDPLNWVNSMCEFSNYDCVGAGLRFDAAPSPVPEPCTMILLSLGIFALLGFKKRKLFPK